MSRKNFRVRALARGGQSLHCLVLNTELIPAAEADSKWLMVVLHGLGDSMDGFRWLPRALDNPRLNLLLVKRRTII
ncbi:MAG: hypothetical protein CM1200mP34_0310 [Verrucomicrobiales bacterium]|nr:MAG: hypothetical protein CM1200mP34_0310 [Verrucomicrobiales bacterium]